jgi:hypothetical protein
MTGKFQKMKVPTTFDMRNFWEKSQTIYVKLEQVLISIRLTATGAIVTLV